MLTPRKIFVRPIHSGDDEEIMGLFNTILRDVLYFHSKSQKQAQKQEETEEGHRVIQKAFLREGEWYSFKLKKRGGPVHCRLEDGKTYTVTEDDHVKIFQAEEDNLAQIWIGAELEVVLEVTTKEDL